MNTRTACVCVTLGLLLGCRTSVNLSVENTTPFIQEVKVSVKDSRGVTDKTIEVGKVANGKSVPVSFKAKHYGQFVVTGSIPGSADISQESRTVMPDPDPLTTSVTLRIEEGKVLKSGEEAIDQLTAGTSSMGPNVGFDPIGLPDALKTVFGALIVYGPPVTGGSGRPYYFFLNAAQFGSVLPLEQCTWIGRTQKDSTEITGTASAQARAAIPLYGSLGIDFTSSDVYKVSWLLENAGKFVKPDPPNWNYMTAVRDLDPYLQHQLYEAVVKHPGARVTYVNEMYVVKHATFAVQKGRKLSAGEKIEAVSVVSQSGAWTYSATETKERTFSDLVVNIGGPELLVLVADLAPAASGTDTNKKVVSPVTGTPTHVGEPLLTTGTDTNKGIVPAMGGTGMNKDAPPPMYEPNETSVVMTSVGTVDTQPIKSLDSFLSGHSRILLIEKPRDETTDVPIAVTIPPDAKSVQP